MSAVSCVSERGPSRVVASYSHHSDMCCCCGDKTYMCCPHPPTVTGVWQHDKKMQPGMPRVMSSCSVKRLWILHASG